MSSIDTLKRYLDKTQEFYGITGSDIHLWLEGLPRHNQMNFEESLKLKKKVEERFGHLYGISLAWSIAFLHILMDCDPNSRQVIVLQKQGEVLVPTVKTERDYIEEIQKARRDGDRKDTDNGTQPT